VRLTYRRRVGVDDREEQTWREQSKRQQHSSRQV
jgi:hypothetical protein